MNRNFFVLFVIIYQFISGCKLIHLRVGFDKAIVKPGSIANFGKIIESNNSAEAQKYFTNGRHVFFVCTKFSPITLEVDFILSRFEVDVEQIREVKDLFNSTYIYTISFKWNENNLKDEDFILRINCFEILNPSRTPYVVYMFYNRDPKNHLFINQKPGLNYGSIIPCVSTTPGSPKLIKHTENGDEEILNAEYLHHLGFKLENGTFDGNYSCQSGNSSIFWSTRIEEDLKVFPTNGEIFTTRRRKVNLTCGSNQLVEFHFDLNLREKYNVEWIDNSTNFKSFKLQYISKWEKYGENFGQIICWSGTKNFTWDVKVIKKIQINSTYQVGRSACVVYEDFYRFEFEVRGKIIECSNPLSCSLSSCLGNSSCLTSPSGNQLVFRDSTDSKICPNVFDSAYPKTCFTFESHNVRWGVIQCGIGDLVVSESFFYGLSLPEKVMDWKKTHISNLIAFQPMKPVYFLNATTDPEDEDIDLVTCVATPFIFSDKLQFTYIDKYGNRGMVEDPIEQHDNTGSILLRNSFNPLTLSVDVVTVICHAPWRNSSDWLQIEHPIDLRYKLPPLINTSNIFPEYNFLLNSTGNFLVCQVEGHPRPDSDIKWVFHGKELPKNFSIRQNSQYESRLEFPRIKDDFQGVYTCIATNQFGFTDSAKYTVNVYEEEIPPKDNNLGLILGLSVSFFIVFISLLYIAICKNSRNKYRGIAEFLNGSTGESSSKGMYMGLKIPYDPKFEIPLDELDICCNEVLGKGQFGVVLKGVFQGRGVAVKRPINGASGDAFVAFLAELKILSQIGAHEHVIEFIGASTVYIREKKVYAIVELCPMGNLHSFLRKNAESFQDLFRAKENCIKNDCGMNSYDLTLWAYQIASGMSYLASKKVIHGDLATRNVLLFDKHHAKISDFGLSHQLSHQYSVYIKKPKQGKALAWPWPWLALESLKFLTFSTESDIWGYGVTIWEIFSFGLVPYIGHTHSPEFVNLIEGGLRLHMPPNSSIHIYEQMARCWDKTPKDRPTFDDLKEFFQGILLELSANFNIDINFFTYADLNLEQ